MRSIREGNAELQQIDARLKQQAELVQQALDRLYQAEVARLTCVKKMEEQRQQLAALEQDPAIVALTPHQQQGLDQRYASQPDPITLRSLGACCPNWWQL